MIKRLFFAALIGLALPPTMAAEFSGYVAISSDYVRRGVTQSDSGPALQLGGDVLFDSGWFLGVWGSTVDIDNGPARHRDRELNSYLGYDYDISEDWRVSVLAVSYEYPRQTGSVNYDHVEYSITANFNDLIWIEYSHSPDLYNTKQASHNFEAFVETGLTDNWNIGGGAGYYDVSNLVGKGYGYWQLGVTGNFAYADFDIRYHDTNRSVPIISTDARSQARLAVTVMFPF